MRNNATKIGQKPADEPSRRADGPSTGRALQRRTRAIAPTRPQSSVGREAQPKRSPSSATRKPRKNSEPQEPPSATNGEKKYLSISTSYRTAAYRARAIPSVPSGAPASPLLARDAFGRRPRWRNNVGSFKSRLVSPTPRSNKTTAHREATLLSRAQVSKTKKQAAVVALAVGSPNSTICRKVVAMKEPHMRAVLSRSSKKGCIRERFAEILSLGS